MKIALSFYGQPRFLENPHIHESYRHYFLEKYDVDVFGHMWWKENGKYDVSNWTGIDECPIHPESVDIICSLYNPKELRVDEPEKFKHSSKTLKYIDDKFTGKLPSWNHTNYSNILSHLYSIQTSSNIVKKYAEDYNIKYDFIIMARYDTILYRVPDLTKCNTEKLHLPHHHPRFPDVIIFYPMKHLNWSTNVYNDVDSVYENVFSPGPEGFKYFSFIKRFPVTDIQPTKMDGHCVRKSCDTLADAKFFNNYVDNSWELSKSYYKS